MAALLFHIPVCPAVRPFTLPDYNFFEAEQSKLISNTMCQCLCRHLSLALQQAFKTVLSAKRPVAVRNSEKPNMENLHECEITAYKPLACDNSEHILNYLVEAKAKIM